MCRVMMVEMMNVYGLSVHYVKYENIIEPTSQARHVEHAVIKSR